MKPHPPESRDAEPIRAAPHLACARGAWTDGPLMGLAQQNHQRPWHHQEAWAWRSLFSDMLLVLSGVATGLSWLCYFRALQLGEASRVAPVDKLSVVFAIVFAALFLHESLTWQHWLGGSLVVAGAVVLAW